MAAFHRPVRLFRIATLEGYHSLEGEANGKDVRTSYAQTKVIEDPVTFKRCAHTLRPSEIERIVPTNFSGVIPADFAADSIVVLSIVIRFIHSPPIVRQLPK